MIERLARRTLLAALLPTLLLGCAEPGARRDPFAGLRAEAEAAPGPLRPEAAASGRFAATEPDRPPVRGFVRRGGGAGLPTPGGGEGPPGDFTINFEGANLREVVRAMLEDGLGANYVLDPAVSGSVTMRTNRPLRREEILPTLEEILRLNDAAIVDRGGVFSILPGDAVGRAAPVLTARDAAARGLSIRVTPLRFVTVADVREVLSAFEPIAGGVTYDPRRNLVFSIGTAEEQRTIAEILQVLDANAFAGRSLALQPLRHADPEAVGEELSDIFGGGEPIRFLPINRLGAVLIIAEAPGLMEDARALARSLDQIGAETPQLYVYAVENRDASELAQMVGGLLGVDVTVSGGGRSGALGPGLTAETTGDDAALAAADAGAPAPAPASGGGPGAEGVVRIAADEGGNAIVALATADGARRVESALRRLDRQPLQVMIQATLAEVVLNDRLEFGVRWFFESGNWSGGFSDFADGAVGAVFPGFSAVFETADIRVALSALDQVTDVRLLSSPTLMVLDNETARLQVGDQVPVTTRSSTSVTDPQAPIVTETEFRDTGVILTIRPRVNDSGLVMLDIRQEVSEVVPSGDADNPTFSQRVVESSVAVDSGDTVAIGGLIRESDSRSRAGLPGLSRIPILGAAFGGSEFQGARTELIVLLTPRVVRNQRDARAATAELRDKLRGVFGPPPETYPLTGAARGSLADGPAGLEGLGGR
jgi:general secretion pathway protein D